jgi:hypothetical protein
MILTVLGALSMISVIRDFHNQYQTCQSRSSYRYIYFNQKAILLMLGEHQKSVVAGNTKGGGIIVPLTSYLTGLESAV